jgi:phospholipase/carboxylesterase
VSALTQLVREPDGAAAGTLVLLHGRGTDEHDLFGLFDVFDPQRRLRGITVGGPLRLPPGGKHWYSVPRVGFPDHDTFHASYAQLGEYLDEEAGIDWSQTVVGGFSQGAVMSYAIGLGEGRPVPAGILAMSGFIPTVPGWQPSFEGRRDLPVLITHGSLDPVIAVDFARQARTRIEEGGALVTYHESEMPHAIDPRVIPEISDWLGARF